MKQQFIKKLKQKFFIRLHMSLIITATMLSALAFSKIAYYFGWTDLTTRYVGGFLFSYGVFILSIRLWLYYIFKTAPTNNTDLSDGDFLDLWVIGSSKPTNPSYLGRGGDSSGAGASDSWGNESKSLSSKITDIDIGDADEALPLVLVIAIIAFVFMIFAGGAYLIVEAPLFLGELAFQLALTLGIIKSAQDKQHPVTWLEACVKKTIIPVLIICLLIGMLGKAINYYAPSVTKSSEVIEAIKNYSTVDK